MNLLIGALAMGLLLSLATLGLFVSFRVLRTIDLTAEGAFGIGAAVAATAVAHGASPVIATLVGVVTGALAGIVTGFQHTRLRIDPLLAGILTSTALYSGMLYVMGGGELSIVTRETVFSGAERLWRRGGGGDMVVFGTSVAAAGWASLALLVALVAATALGLAWFFRARVGLALRAAGDNPSMAQAQAIDIGRMTVIGVAVANALVGLCGALFAQYQGFATVQMALGTFVTAVGCLVLGEALFGRDRIGRQLAGAIAGTVAFRLLVAAALRAGLDPSALKLATAVFVVGVLLLQNRARRLLARPHRAAGVV
jgi:putative tryptophan/tyrosine transport system permease protein